MSMPKPVLFVKVNSKQETKEKKDVSEEDLSSEQKLNSEKKVVSENENVSKLLDSVFNADPKGLKEFLSNLSQDDKSQYILKRTRYQEGYPSLSKGAFVCKREWQNISPLEAAAWAGDNFLLNELLSYVPPERKKEAIEQLQGILNKEETGYEYLEPYRELIKSYERYIGQIELLTKEMNYKKLKELWLLIGKYQGLLPTYGLQELCDRKTHSPIPEFKQEPMRTIQLVTFFGSSFFSPPLNMDLLGSKYSLFKGPLDYASTGTELLYGKKDWIFCDCEALRVLCRTRREELTQIIENLIHPPSKCCCVIL